METPDIAEPGLFIKIHYSIKSSDGKTVGVSRKGDPLGFVIGKGKVLKGLELGVVGLRPGESRTIHIPPEQGYGHRTSDKIIRVPKKELPTLKDIRIGRTVQYMNESGGMVNFLIVAVDDETVTLDANHPFAGQELIYDVTVVSVEYPL